MQAAALRCRGLLEEDPELLMGAVELARRSRRFIDHAGACEDAAAVLSVTGRNGEAREHLSEALAKYEAVGARAWARRTRAALRALGVRSGSRGPRRRPTRGWESLTPTERAVAESIAEGLTNRDVGKRLHISPHTVAASGEPFDRWFRDHVRDVHGVALEDGFPPPEQILDFRAEQAGGR